MKIGAKITYDQTPERLLVNVSGKADKKRVSLLGLWLGLWSICGIAVMSQIIGLYTREEKLIMAVYLVFWLYFEYKIYYAMRWRMGGVEIIKVAEGKLSYSREINGQGKVQNFDIEGIRKLKVIDYSDSPFQQSYYSAYWSVGGEMLAFDYYGREHRIAMQVTESDAKQLKKVLDKAI